MTTNNELFPGLPESVSDLNQIAKGLVEKAQQQLNKLVETINYGIYLLENFRYQTKKLDLLGYCDYSLAYVCYQTCTFLLQSSSQLSSKNARPFLQLLVDALDLYRGKFEDIKLFIESQRSTTSDTARHLLDNKKLSNGLSNVSSNGFKNGVNNGYTNNEDQMYLFDLLLLSYFDFVTPQQLNSLIRMPSTSVLLLDFRTEKEYNYSHINFSNVVNIVPSLVSDLLQRNPAATDLDLELALSTTLSEESMTLFKNRQKFDLVVIYNLRYGQPNCSKYNGLELLSQATSKLIKSSFRSLIELIVWKNKYLSSKLKQFPLILDGGLESWYQVYGQQSLVRTAVKQSEPGKQTTKAGSTESESLYVRNINDYISTNTPTLRMGSLKSTQSREPLGSTEKVLSISRGQKNDTNMFSFVNDKPKVHQTTVTSSGVVATKPRIRDPSSKVNAKNPASSTSGIVNSGGAFECLATGLTNLGNSCYINCVLQCLVATPVLTNFFFNGTIDFASASAPYKEYINKSNRLGTKGAVTTTLVKLMNDMFKSRGKYFTPSDFKKVIGTYSPGQQFATFEQQDCIEFLNFILDSVHEDLNRKRLDNASECAKLVELSPEDEKQREVLPVRLASAIEWERYLALNLSVIVDNFQGQYLSRLRCLICNLTSTTYNSFSILSLPIPETLGTKRLTLFDCLDFFTETELLDDDNKWHCPVCKTFTRLTKKIIITRLPSVLIIHFKRFSQSEGRFKKLDTFIDYPVDSPLDLTPYWPSVATYLDDNSRHKMDAGSEERYLETLPERNQKPPFIYKLYGVVNHFGNLTTGHYTSYVHKAGIGRNEHNWYYFDDSKYTPGCSVSKVLNANAYCLFFKRT